MKIHATTNRNKQFAIDFSVTGTTLTYQVRRCYPTSVRTSHGAVEQIENGMAMHGPIAPEHADPKDIVYSKDGWDVYGAVAEPVTIYLNNLHEHADFADCSAFNFFWDYDWLRLKALPTYSEVGSYRMLQEVQLFNGLAMSRESRFTQRQCATLLLHTKPLGAIIVPFKDSPIEDWTLVFNMLDPSLCRDLNGGVVQPVISLDTARDDLFPLVVFEKPTVSVSPGGEVVLQISLQDSEGRQLTNSAEIFFESSGGYLPKTRTAVVNGRGQIKVVASHLEPGDTFKVKAGFKYFSGVSDCLMRVV